MRTLIVAVAIGSLFGMSAALANGAKPTSPSEFGSQAASQAQAGGFGDTVSTIATTTDKGVSDEVDLGRQLSDSKPNLPPTHP